MTPLQRQSLTMMPLTEETVQSFYDGSRSGTAEQCLHALCESHEQLRAKLAVCKFLLAKEISAECRESLESKIAAALALTDTGSEDFLRTFPEDENSGGVEGWRVVEKIREVLLTDAPKSA